MNNTELQNKPQYQEEESIDLKNIIIKIISYWYLFVIGVVIALAIGFIYNRYTPKVYQVSASIFVKEDKMTVGQYVAATAKELGGSIKIDSFVLYEKGEGLEKREDDFAEEIAKLTGKA